MWSLQARRRSRQRWQAIDAMKPGNRIQRNRAAIRAHAAGRRRKRREQLQARRGKDVGQAQLCSGARQTGEKQTFGFRLGQAGEFGAVAVL
jgi:hypothetical protein